LTASSLRRRADARRRALRNLRRKRQPRKACSHGQRGQSFTPKRRGDPDDALPVIDAAGARRPVLMGSLDGARSLALLAATRPERVGGLIAVSPTARAATSPEFADSAAQTPLR
jgi:pimeloyl-ACP methyl ester carboxylesterase